MVVTVSGLTWAGWQVDFLPSKAMTAEEIAEQQSLFESLAKATRSISVEVDGQPIEMQVMLFLSRMAIWHGSAEPACAFLEQFVPAALLIVGL